MRKLYDLDAREVSLVTRGANKKKFLIFKNHEGKDMEISNKEMEKMLNVDPKMLGRVEEVIKSMHKAMPAEESKEPAAHAPEHGALSPHAQAALKAMARIAAPHKDEIHQGHVAQVMNEAGVPEHKDATKKDEVSMEWAMPEDVKEEHHMAALEKARKAYKDDLCKSGYEKYKSEEMEKTKKEDDEEEDVEMKKSGISKSDLEKLPEALRKKIEEIAKSENESKMALEKQKEEIKKREQEEREKELVAKSEEFKNLAIPKEDILAQLKVADQVGPEAYEMVVKNFQALDNQGKDSNIFKTYGTSTPGPIDEEKELDQIVDSIVLKGSNKTREQIYVEVSKTAKGQALLKNIMNKKLGGGR